MTTGSRGTEATLFSGGLSVTTASGFVLLSFLFLGDLDDPRFLDGDRDLDLYLDLDLDLE